MSARSPARPRLRVLLSAFGCRPGWGSEPEVGFRALLAAGSACDVWVLTTPGNAAALEGFLRDDPVRTHVRVEGVPLGVPEERLDRIGLPAFHALYERWQRRAGRRGVELDRCVDFDVVHHVTLAACWARAGVAAVPKPLVWGPVGGGVETPSALRAELGARGLAADAARVLLRRLLFVAGPARAARRGASVTLAQNEATARRLRGAGHVEVLPNATATTPAVPAVPPTRTREVVFVGRLVAWKGGTLAVRAMRLVRHPDATLRVFGAGPDRERMARLARALDIGGRVVFEDRTARDELFRTVARAGAVLHPAVHDEAPLAVAEALSLGTPVVCLDHGGPGTLVRLWPEAPSTAVRAAGRQETARRLAVAVDGFLSAPPPVARAAVRPQVSFSERLLHSYALAVGDAT